MKYLAAAATLVRATTRPLLCAWARLNGYNHEYSRTAIDREIEPLVKALNTGGRVRTIDSCAGHVGKSFPPYISFQTSVRTAGRLDAFLRQGTPLLKADWLVVGMFDDKGGFFFRLFSPQYEAAAQSLLSSMLWFGVRRHAVNSDIQTMAVVIERGLLNDTAEESSFLL